MSKQWDYPVGFNVRREMIEIADPCDPPCHCVHYRPGKITTTIVDARSETRDVRSQGRPWWRFWR